MNIFDRIVTALSPAAGVQRAAARAILDQYAQRDYGAGKQGRRNKGWSARSTSANVEVASGLRILRDRAREFVRDSWQGQRILDVLTAHVVGTGITMSPNTGSDRDDRRFRQAFEPWSESADVEGIQNFGAHQALAVRSMIEGGESVTRFIDIPPSEADGTVPFRILGLEGDQIDSTRDRGIGGENRRLGVELGEWGRRKGLWLHPDHPGEMAAAGLTPSTMIGWDDLCHIYRPLRWGQLRGVTWFAPILLPARELQDLIEAAIVQARTQASFAGFIKRQPGAGNILAAKKDENAKLVSRLEPGTIADIGDADIVFAQPSGQSSFAEVYMAGCHAMAAGAGLTYDQLTGDLRQANYSSLRAGKIEFRRLVSQVQWLIAVPQLLMPVKRRFVARASLAELLPPRKHGWPVDFIMPANEPIDPKKDLEADILAVRSGRMSPQEFVSAWGYDWRKVVEDSRVFWTAVDKAKQAFDIDPRKPPAGAPRPEAKEEP